MVSPSEEEIQEFYEEENEYQDSQDAFEEAYIETDSD